MKGALAPAASWDLQLVKYWICDMTEGKKKKKKQLYMLVLILVLLNICKYIDSHTREYSQFTVM